MDPIKVRPGLKVMEKAVSFHRQQMEEYQTITPTRDQQAPCTAISVLLIEKVDMMAM